MPITLVLGDMGRKIELQQLTGQLVYPVSERDLVSKEKVDSDRGSHLMSISGLHACT